MRMTRRWSSPHSTCSMDRRRSQRHLRDLPSEFIRRNAADPRWLATLPDLIEQCEHRWSLSIETHFPHIAYNYVASARRQDGTRCVLKLSRHLVETRSAIAALQL